MTQVYNTRIDATSQELIRFPANSRARSAMRR